VTMDEIPFAVDAAIDVRHADCHRGGSIGIDRYVAASKPTVQATSPLSNGTMSSGTK